MKIILTTTTLIAILAIGLLGLNNSSSNNIGNAFAQMSSEDLPMEEMMEDETVTMTMSNQSEPMVNWTGTIDVKSTIGEAFKSKVTVNIIDAINAAQTNVGANSTVKKAELTPAHGYLVYKIMVVDENMKKYKVIVDPGNGQVLMKKEITWYDEQKMKHGEEKYDKYGHDDQYDKKKMMMMKDKKY
ncbi:MAG: PepSY domain-containing protein [Nitrososphaeraceae archaeon]